MRVVYSLRYMILRHNILKLSYKNSVHHMPLMYNVTHYDNQNSKEKHFFTNKQKHFFAQIMGEPRTADFGTIINAHTHKHTHAHAHSSNKFPVYTIHVHND